MNQADKIEYVAKSYPYTTLMTNEFYKHRHAFYEIVVCLRGNATHLINDARYPFAAGDVIVMKPDAVHDYKILPPAESYAHYDFYSSAADFADACEHLKQPLSQVLPSGPEPLLFRVDEPTLGMLQSSLSRLNTLQSGEHMARSASSLYYALLHLICGLMMEKQSAQEGALPEFLSRLMSEMSRPEILCGSIDEVIRLSGYSHGHLCKLFKLYTGNTLINYFTKLKVDYSTVLLKSKKLSILDVASTVGYTSLSHFIHIFKQYNGVTPKQYRKILFEGISG